MEIIDIENKCNAILILYRRILDDTNTNEEGDIFVRFNDILIELELHLSNRLKEVIQLSMSEV
jgi:hypothetical protein